MRLSDPTFEKYYVQARLEALRGGQAIPDGQTLRGGRPFRRSRRVARPN